MNERSTLDDTTLANEIITRLNALIANEDVRKDIEALMMAGVGCSETTKGHPTIQVNGPYFRFLGLLNGIVGAIPEGRLKGWGYVAAVFDDENHLTHFRRTDLPAAPAILSAG